MTAPRFYLCAADAPTTEGLYYTSTDFRTWHGSPSTWGRWTIASDAAQAMDAAAAHVRTFKRCKSIDGGSASAYR